MIENIPVTCLIDRYWDTEAKKYNGTTASGTLLAVNVQSDEYEPDILIPVGIVKMADGTFQSIPLEYLNVSEI